MDGVSCIELVRGKRLVQIPYRNLRFRAPVRTVGDHADLVIRSAVRGAAASIGKILLLPAEEELCAQADECEAEIDEKLVLPCQTARTHLDELIDDQSTDGVSGESVMVRMQKPIIVLK
eukprot:6460904-Amphidinium_carterae.1